MERFKAVDAGVITQKENDPSLAKDENDRILQREITDSNTKLNFAQQVGGECSTCIVYRPTRGSRHYFS